MPRAGKWIVVQNDTYWQPTTVAPDWQPYLNGDWSLLGGQWCFNPIEPWGYLTCHYGNWCYFRSAGWC